MAASKRSYGTASLFEKADSAGRVNWYGKWRHDGVQVKRKIGPKKVEGSKDGLTKRAAEAQLAKLRATVRPTAHAAEARTIRDVGADYVQHLTRMGRKLSTLTAVESGLRVHLEPFFRERAIDSVTHEEVIDLMHKMEANGVGPKSIRNYMGTLSAIYRYAMHPQRRWATSNPCDGLELPAVPEHEGIRYLELDQVEALVGGVQDGPYADVDRAMYPTAAMTGMREGELIALQWQDVDWTASAIRVRRNYVLGEITTPKSKRSMRSVPMAPTVAAALDALAKAVGEPGGEALVFADPITGGPLDKAGVLRRFRKALKAAKLDEAHRFHDLRHTFGTQMAAMPGVTMRALQAWMGHRDLKTTERYADYAPKHDEAQLVAAAFVRADAAGVPVEVPI
jgi:integrase